jgi:hypothetical protein
MSSLKLIDTMSSLKLIDTISILKLIEKKYTLGKLQILYHSGPVFTNPFLDLRIYFEPRKLCQWFENIQATSDGYVRKGNFFITNELDRDS